MARLAGDGPNDEEFAYAVAYLLDREPFRRETARQWADLLAEPALPTAADVDGAEATIALRRSEPTPGLTGQPPVSASFHSMRNEPSPAPPA